jgi:hypothetical protein
VERRQCELSKDKEEKRNKDEKKETNKREEEKQTNKQSKQIEQSNKKTNKSIKQAIQNKQTIQQTKNNQNKQNKLPVIAGSVRNECDAPLSAANSLRASKCLSHPRPFQKRNKTNKSKNKTKDTLSCVTHVGDVGSGSTLQQTFLVFVFHRHCSAETSKLGSKSSCF